MLHVLLSQVILASLEHGVREGRILLHDWLVILIAQYNDVYKLVQFDHRNSTTVNIDVSFSQCPQLQPLVRLVFALLRNHLLRLHEEGVHPDHRIYLQCLFRYMVYAILLKINHPIEVQYGYTNLFFLFIHPPSHFSFLVFLIGFSPITSSITIGQSIGVMD